MPGPLHPRSSLSGLVDGRLPAWRRLLLEHHLGGCTRCALEVARIRSLRRLLADSPVPEPDPDLLDRLLLIGRPVDPAEPAAAAVPRPRRHEPVGLVVAGLVLVAALGTAAAITGAVPAADAPTATVRASLVDVLPRLWTWSLEPDGAPGDRTADNVDSP